MKEVESLRNKRKRRVQRDMREQKREAIGGIAKNGQFGYLGAPSSFCRNQKGSSIFLPIHCRETLLTCKEGDAPVFSISSFREKPREKMSAKPAFPTLSLEEVRWPPTVDHQLKSF